MANTITENLASVKIALETLAKYELSEVEGKVQVVEKVIKTDIGIVASGVSIGLQDVKVEVSGLSTEAKTLETNIASGVSAVESGFVATLKADEIKVENFFKGLGTAIVNEFKKVESDINANDVEKIATELSAFVAKITKQA